MSSVQNLVDYFKLSGLYQSQYEKMLLEAELFVTICEELKEIMKFENKDYLRLLKINNKKDVNMIDASFLRCIINDILSTNEYSLPGIAYYSDTPDEIIYEVMSGRNNNPSLNLSQRILEIHRAVRPELYDGIIAKIRDNSSGVRV